MENSTQQSSAMPRINEVAPDFNAPTTHGQKKLEDYRGKLSRKRSNDPWIYTRAQYASMLLRGDTLMKNV